MINFLDVTFMIPFKDSDETRHEGLKNLLNYLTNYFICNIIVYEVGESSTYEKNIKNNIDDSFITYIFEYQNNNETFHKTKILNKIYDISKTKILIMQDADIFIPINAYVEGVKLVLNNEADLVIPFKSGNSIINSTDFSNISLLNNNNIENFIVNLKQIVYFFDDSYNEFIYKYDKDSPSAPGGCHIFLKNIFEECYLENEEFIGYGPEDAEKIMRYELFDKKISRTDNFAMHWIHSNHHRFYDKIQTSFNNELFYKLKNMNAQELHNYYQSRKYYTDRKNNENK